MVKSRPDVLARNLPKLLNSSASSVSSLVNQMVKRGMIVSVPESMDEFKRRKPKGAGRPSLKLRVSPELRGTYEWLPLLKPASKPEPAQKPQPAKLNLDDLTIKEAQPAKLNLDDLTIKQARTLYLELKSLFGEN